MSWCSDASEGSDSGPCQPTPRTPFIHGHWNEHSFNEDGGLGLHAVDRVDHDSNDATESPFQPPRPPTPAPFTLGLIGFDNEEDYEPGIEVEDEDDVEPGLTIVCQREMPRVLVTEREVNDILSDAVRLAQEQDPLLPSVPTSNLHDALLFSPFPHGHAISHAAEDGRPPAEEEVIYPEDLDTPPPALAVLPPTPEPATSTDIPDVDTEDQTTIEPGSRLSAATVAATSYVPDGDDSEAVRTRPPTELGHQAPVGPITLSDPSTPPRLGYSSSAPETASGGPVQVRAVSFLYIHGLERSHSSQLLAPSPPHPTPLFSPATQPISHLPVSAVHTGFYSSPFQLSSSLQTPAPHTFSQALDATASSPSSFASPFSDAVPIPSNPQSSPMPFHGSYFGLQQPVPQPPQHRARTSSQLRHHVACFSHNQCPLCRSSLIQARALARLSGNARLEPHVLRRAQRRMCPHVARATNRAAERARYVPPPTPRTGGSVRRGSRSSSMSAHTPRRAAVKRGTPPRGTRRAQAQVAATMEMYVEDVGMEVVDEVSVQPAQSAFNMGAVVGWNPPPPVPVPVPQVFGWDAQTQVYPGFGMNAGWPTGPSLQAVSAPEMFPVVTDIPMSVDDGKSKWHFPGLGCL